MQSKGANEVPTDLHDMYVITTVDKAKSKVGLICKRSLCLENIEQLTRNQQIHIYISSYRLLVQSQQYNP